MKRLLSNAHQLLKSSRRNDILKLHGGTAYYSSVNVPSNSSKKLVIFDKDGTLTCLHTMWSAWCEDTASTIGKRIGKNIADDFYGLVNYDKANRLIEKGNLATHTQQWLIDGLVEILVSVHGVERGRAISAVEESWLPPFDKTEMNLGKSDKVKALGDVKNILETLRNHGFKIAVCTSDSRESAHFSLVSLGIVDMVDRLLCGDDFDNTAKPAPDNIHLLCKEFGVGLEDAIMIGDSPHDTVMGQASNCGTTIGVLSGLNTKEELCDADVIVQNIDEALKFILENHSPDNSSFTPGSHADPRKSSSTTRRSTRMFSTRSLLQPDAPLNIARKFSTSSQRFKEFTHIIVGAGSAGCVLANRLTEDSGNSVLLLEAGPKDTVFNSRKMVWKIHMPAALTYNLCDDKYNWFYHTVPQKNLNNRAIYCPRGRVWGGSSSLNAMVYIRGHAYDYDRWEKEGAKGWDYDHCLPYFKKAQCHGLGGDTYRGGEGPLKVSQGDTTTPLYQAFIEAGPQAGYPFTPDMNGYQQEGVGPMDMTVHDGYRWNTATAYLRPALERSNLHTEVKCLTTKLLFDGKKAIGVECLQTGNRREFHGAKEVILCGGAINSPQLLMLSGIGNSTDLKKLDIPVVQHLPGVGKNFQDHLELYIQHKCKKPITLYSATKKHNMIRIGAQWFLNRSGMGATTHLHAGGFIRSKPGISHPDIQFHFLPSQVIDHGRKDPECHAFQVHVGTLRETSVGWMKLKSKDPNEHPIIDSNLLHTEEDRVDLRNCVKLTREIFKQKAFDELRAEEIKPGPQVQSDSEIDQFVRAAADTAYHPSCTCKMGAESDDMAVVNHEGKVYGTENLRVVDSSIMPSVVSGNLNAPTIMIAEKIADAIRGSEPLCLPDTPVYRPETLATQR